MYNLTKCALCGNEAELELSHTVPKMAVKRMCGLDMGENYNKSKKENPEVKQCPQEKVEYIKDALRHFKLI